MKIVIALFCSLILYSCGSINRVKGPKELDRRSGRTAKLKRHSNRKSIKSGSGPTLIAPKAFKAWLHGYQVTNDMFFHGGEVTIREDQPSWQWEGK